MSRKILIGVVYGNEDEGIIQERLIEVGCPVGLTDIARDVALLEVNKMLNQIQQEVDDAHEE